MSLLQNASSISSNKRISIDAIDNVNQLPDDMLSKILSELSTEEAIKTCVLSKQWGDTWKQVSNLCFDMRKTITINGIVLPQLLDRAANQITEFFFFFLSIITEVLFIFLSIFNLTSLNQLLIKGILD